MFTIEQIKKAHSNVNSGADFPRYIQDLIELGVLSYATYVSDGHTDYFGENNFAISSGIKYETIAVADDSDIAQFKNGLKEHQQGKTTYPEFCNLSAKSGVEKWVVTMANMTCAYYDKAGNEMLVEIIPVP